MSRFSSGSSATEMYRVLAACFCCSNGATVDSHPPKVTVSFFEGL